MTDLLTQSSAHVSECGTYRYSLTRKWGSGPICTFIMLNPSKADASEDDPTIRRCISFAKREGCEGLLVENLYAFRATKPIDLTKAADPVGPLNDAAIRAAIRMAEKHEWPLVAAWGAHWMAEDRGAEIADWARFKCLGRTKRLMPRHPLYVKGDAPLIDLY